MRKLFVLALAVVFGVMIFAGAQYPGDFSNVQLTGNAVINVHQWLDASFTPGEFDIYDYGEDIYDIDLGDLWVDSNANVNVSVAVTLGTLESYITDYTVSPSGEIGADNATYDVELLGANIDPDTPAGGYTIGVTITLNPTVSL